MAWLRDRIEDGVWLWAVLRRRARRRWFALRRRVAAPALPVSADGKVRIHLGCGEIAAAGFINVDTQPGPHVHYVRDVTDLSVFADNEADLVYASHVLEHVRRPALRETLWEWRRVLKSGGVLRVSVPDFDRIVAIYQSRGRDMAGVQAVLMGGQEERSNTHYIAFNRTYLEEKLREAGFREIRPWRPEEVADHDFEDWASRPLERSGGRFDVSLNLEAVK